MGAPDSRARRWRRRAADEHRKPDAKDRPVQVDPGSGVHGANRAERGERGEPDGHSDAASEPRTTAADHADQPVTSGGHRAGAEAPQHPAVLVAGSELAGDGLYPEDEADQGGDRPEPAERDRLGLDGQLDLAHDHARSTWNCRSSPAGEFDELALHRGDAGPARVELEPVEDRRSALGEMAIA